MGMAACSDEAAMFRVWLNESEHFKAAPANMKVGT